MCGGDRALQTKAYPPMKACGTDRERGKGLPERGGTLPWTTANKRCWALEPVGIIQSTPNVVRNAQSHDGIMQHPAILAGDGGDVHHPAAVFAAGDGGPVAAFLTFEPKRHPHREGRLPCGMRKKKRRSLGQDRLRYHNQTKPRGYHCLRGVTAQRGRTLHDL
jgi:hypothetical protein